MRCRGSAEETIGGAGPGRDSSPDRRATEDDCARLTYLRACNVLWALGSGACQEIIDGAPAVHDTGLRLTAWLPPTRCTGSCDVITVSRRAALWLPKGSYSIDLPAIVGAGKTAW